MKEIFKNYNTTFTNSPSNPMEVKVKKLSNDAVIPSFAKEGDAAMDLTAISVDINESIARTTVLYGTGLAMEIPTGWAGFIFPRSSVYKTSLRLSNSVGVIDSGYRGEIMLNFTVIHNPLQPNTWKSNIYQIGDRVGQIAFFPIHNIQMTEVQDLEESDRGIGGFGSTGK